MFDVRGRLDSPAEYDQCIEMVKFLVEGPSFLFDPKSSK